MGLFYPYQPIQFLSGLIGILQGLTGLAPLSLAFQASAVANAATITIPAGAAEGDIAVLLDFANNAASGNVTDVVPTRWTGLGTATLTSGTTRGRVRASYKILTTGEPGTSVTGLNDGEEEKVMLVFRPGRFVGQVDIGTWNAEVVTTNPASQAVNASGLATPLAVIGYAAIRQGTAAFATASPAFDATVATADADGLAGYKVYSAGSTPANHTIDQADLGTINGPTSGYVRAIEASAWADSMASQTLNSFHASWNSFTIRVVIPAADLAQTGGKVRVTLQGAGVFGATDIDAAYIGHQALSGDLYDFDGTPKQLTVGGSGAFSIAQDGTVVCDPVDMLCHEAHNLIISLAIAATGNPRLAIKTSATGHTSYYKAGNDASTVNATGYSTGTADQLYTVKQIEVWR